MAYSLFSLGENQTSEDLSSQWVFGATLLAFFGSFGGVVYISIEVYKEQLGLYGTFYAIAMGLLGSSLYLLYNLIGVIREHSFYDDDWRKNISRLLVGPVAGWLVYFMLISNWGSEGMTSQPIEGGTEEEKKEVINKVDSIQIWLPFLAGYSSDLMVGIINQLIRAVKYTLGIEKMDDKAKTHLTSGTQNTEEGAETNEGVEGAETKENDGKKTD